MFFYWRWKKTLKVEERPVKTYPLKSDKSTVMLFKNKKMTGFDRN